MYWRSPKHKHQRKNRSASLRSSRPEVWSMRVGMTRMSREDGRWTSVGQRPSRQRRVLVDQVRRKQHSASNGGLTEMETWVGTWY